MNQSLVDGPVDTYTHPDILAASADGATGYDPVDPDLIDWAARRAEALIPFALVDGRPVAPNAPTGIRHGRNQFWHWGERACGDALVVAYTGQHWQRHILLVLADEGRGAALPGGGRDPGETAEQAALRELAEEAGLALPDDVIRVIGRPRAVDDPCGSDEAWAATQVLYADYGDVHTLPEVHHGDDADDAAWFCANDYEQLVNAIRTTWDVDVFPGHIEILQAYLADGPDAETPHHRQARNDGWAAGWGAAERTAGTFLTWGSDDEPDHVHVLDPDDRRDLANTINRYLGRIRVGTSTPVHLTRDLAEAAYALAAATADTWPDTPLGTATHALAADIESRYQH